MKTTEATGADGGDAFRRDLLAVLPHLRAFARGLCGRPDFADDLVQETAIKAWSARDRFMPGSNMRAWTFAILRNHYLSELRRNRHQAEYDPDSAERLLVMDADQEAPLHLSDMELALRKLSPERREALMLIGAGGFTYEEAAKICGCAVGTMKSRVARARDQLAHLLDPEGDTIGSERQQA
ncbi:MAG: sigma-70 family RNA polymerase sigma factor [Novosphingobium sp.]|jgi:RNA polymerase sigma-70 factor (ECF subfamily)|nr:sigma-70 family RNA polymerase sigma factor [Novosphingobium sp.]